MPEPNSQHARASKKRRISDFPFPYSLDGYDSSFASGYYDSCDENGHARRTTKNRISEKLRKTEAIKSMPEASHQNTPVDRGSLRDCMHSIVNELREAREKLVEWMKQEIQAVSAANEAKRISCQMVADKREGRVVDHGQSVSKKTGGSEKMENHGRNETNILPGAVNGPEGSVHSRAGNSIGLKGPIVETSEAKNEASDSTTKSDHGVESKETVVLKSRLESSGKGRKKCNAKTETDVDSMHMVGMHPSTKANAKERIETLQSKLCGSPAESKIAITDKCPSSGLAEDVRKGKHTATNSKHDVHFSKSSPAIIKSLDNIPGENKSSFLDVGFEDEVSNEANGLVCSLESAASTKNYSGFGKANNDLHRNFSAYDGTARFEECNKEDPGVDGHFERNAFNSEMFEFSRVVNEAQRGFSFMSSESQITDFGKGFSGNTKRLKSSLEFEQSDRPGTSHPFSREDIGKYYNKTNTGPVMSVQNMHASEMHCRPNATNRPGTKRDCGSAMTFKGSDLESEINGIKPNVEIFNSATCSIGVVKPSANSSDLNAFNKDKIGLLYLQKHSTTSTTTADIPTGVTSWNMLRNLSNPMLPDTKMAHLEYASRSKLGDSISANANFTGLDVPFGFAGANKSGNAVIGGYQQEGRNHMYFSSPCTNSSDFLQSSTSLVGMQFPIAHAQTGNPSTSLSSMLMGLSGHLISHSNPSNTQTFLGLGMNGIPRISNAMSTFPGFLQGNSQHSHIPSKQIPATSSSVVSNKRSTEAHEKEILELNF